MFETILLDISEHVAVLTLNRPEKFNAINTLMHQELQQALRIIADPAQKLRCLLITGHGKGFCAGQDLSDRAVAPGEKMPNLGESIENKYNPLLRKLKSLEMPILCAVNGVAAGAGANIALACDIVLAARSASFIQAFCKLGLIPDSGGTWTLPRLVGLARATALTMLGHRLDAEQAERWGMIWKCLDDGDLMREAMGLAHHLAHQPTRGLAYLKKALAASMQNDFNQQLDVERDLQSLAGQTDDYREGVAAFVEKRQPHFKGH